MEESVWSNYLNSVETQSSKSKAEDDINRGSEDCQRVLGHIVAKSDGSQGNKNEVERLERGPLFADEEQQ